MASRTDPARARRRTLTDAHGEPWEVFEHTPAYDRRSVPTLVFMSEHVVRRVRTFPAAWFELADEELLALSLRR